MDVFEQIREWFGVNPKFFGAFIILVGVFMLLASIFNWDWVFKSNSFNTKKIDGIANMWGRGVARLMLGGGGISCIVFGVLWIALYDQL